jgi:membrane protease YdiL (CAAX protease family)
MTNRWRRGGPSGRHVAAVVGILAAATVLKSAVGLPGQVLVAATSLAGLLAASARAGLTLDDLGLSRDRVRAGLRWGAVPTAVVVAGAALVVAVPALRGRVAAADGTWAGVALDVLVVIPLLTVVPEELAFRGVGWGLFRRLRGSRAATVWSSLLFGVWHVFGALATNPANATARGALGDHPAATVGLVVGTVLVTGAAGVVLAELRSRSGSLVAPVVLHWGLNAVGTVLINVV